MNNTIWVLFSIANAYDQPENNLEAWWWEKPDFGTLAKVMNIKVNEEEGNSTVGRILKGENVRDDDCNYRLREIEEGKIKEEMNNEN